MPKERKAYDDNRRATGTLERIHIKGYGFIERGGGQAPVFVMRSQVQPEHWREGMRFTFVLRPPREGTTAPRADKVLPVIDASRAKAPGPAVEVEL